MRSLQLISATLLAAASLSATAGTDIGVSIGINQPGVYGRIDIGNAPRPALVVAQPVIIAQPRVVVHQQPVYMYVPVDHQRNWSRHCGAYGACAQQVYFVREEWVREHHRGRGKGHDKHRGRGHDRHND